VRYTVHTQKQTLGDHIYEVWNWPLNKKKGKNIGITKKTRENFSFSVAILAFIVSLQVTTQPQVLLLAGFTAGVLSRMLYSAYLFWKL
jgi:hypothetical protein